MTKGKNKGRQRKTMRNREHGAEIGRDKMMGRCVMRGWGRGIAS